MSSIKIHSYISSPLFSTTFADEHYPRIESNGLPTLAYMNLFLSSHFEHFQLDVSIFAVAFGMSGTHGTNFLLCCDICYSGI